ENTRLDMFHKLITVAMHGALHRADFSTPRGILHALDVGYGTGIWLLDMADLYPSARLYGIDTVPEVDFEQPDWGFAHGSFDYIHMSQLLGSVSDWERLCRTAFRYLAPGTGRLELVEVDWEPCCDDGTLSPSLQEPINLWWQCMLEATRATGKSIAYPRNIRAILEHIGFEVELEEKVRIESWDNKVAENDRIREITRWYFGIMGHSPPDSVGDALDSWSGLSMALFTQKLNWHPADVMRLQDSILNNNVMRSSIHLHHFL
ncbi:hypothetical protein M433DRAFT_62118, partial [Acidomyces richmondensis BFW]